MLSRREAHRAHSLVTLSSPRSSSSSPSFSVSLFIFFFVRLFPNEDVGSYPAIRGFWVEVFWRYSAHCPMVRPVAQRRWNRQTSIPLPVWSRAGRRDAVKPAEHRKFPSTKRPRVQQGLRGCSVLLNGASYRGESVIGIRADQTDGTNDQYQDHGEHHCVFCDVLPAIVSQNLGENTHFSAIPFNRKNSDFRRYVRQPNSEPDSTGRLCSGAHAVS